MNRQASAERISFRFLKKLLNKEPDAGFPGELKVGPKDREWSHPVFGELKWEKRFNWWAGKVRMGPNLVDFYLIPGREIPLGAPFNTTLAEKSFQKTLQKEKGLKLKGAQDALDLYNSEWKEESDPELAPQELAARWTPKSFSITRKGDGEIFYDGDWTFTEHEIGIKFRPGGRYVEWSI